MDQNNETKCGFCKGRWGYGYDDVNEDDELYWAVLGNTGLHYAALECTGLYWPGYVVQVVQVVHVVHVIHVVHVVQVVQVVQVFQVD